MTAGTSTKVGARLDAMLVAATNVDAMVTFYGDVLGLDFRAIEGGGFTRHAASLGGVDFVLIPNDIAGIEATDNRHQLAFVVDDVDAVFAAALAAGGSKECDEPGVHGDLKIAIVRDPDGNTIELNQQL